MPSPVLLAGYLALFVLVGGVFLFVNLLVGYLLRPKNPNPEKLEIYECGEPTIGSSFVQFDLRFYVVALIFIVFDAEVAFLYPLSTFFGKSAALASAELSLVEADPATAAPVLTEAAAGLQREMGIEAPAAISATTAEELRAAARRFTWATFAAINVFFVVLLIGFAYEWRTGSLDWVKALSRQRAMRPARAAETSPARTPVLSA
ncbi:MAG: NADH-quinone oxidoreductase subunit A [Planctomycetales bacterium]|nr:NADH-quinone oxidoreductase subunit A [Planctomycetales bacterium]